MALASVFTTLLMDNGATNAGIIDDVFDERSTFTFHRDGQPFKLRVEEETDAITVEVNPSLRSPHLWESACSFLIRNNDPEDTSLEEYKENRKQAYYNAAKAMIQIMDESICRPTVLLYSGGRSIALHVDI